ncbi:MAG TPA: hypothetical protein VHM28_05725, partial [Anaerolineales bacterium]|nr:hypothetical protein [Anaerolineales bacterium]
MKNFDADASAFESAASEQTPTPSSSPTLDWLKDFDSGSSAFNETPASEPVETPKTAPLGGPPVQQEVPDWLKSVGAATPAEPPAENLPDWLKAAAPPTEELPAAQPKPARDETSTPSTNLDWLSSIQPSDSKVFDSSQPAAPALKPEEPSSTPALSSSAFTEDSLSNSDVDNIFGSMQMPDWLSAAAPTQTSAEEKLPPASQSEQSIAPAELPSWVQAMRPVESASSSAGPRSSELETRGPLAGLHGVLPSIPGVTGASSKPKAHSIKLDASEEQQAHAELLERILAAETAPIPMKSSAVVASQRALRWTIFGLFLFILGGVLFAGTQIFPLPAEVPAETGNAIALVESIPADAPVLVAFDYEPSTVGEMEATGASLMDHLLLLKHPRLTLISTSPTGSALAERFMSEVLAARAYQRGQQYADLGYLPGGLAGVYDFSQNPSVVMPYGADSSVVWASVPLQNVTHLSDFAALIVLTDKVESGRVWIEQTASARGKAPLILISSAQAGPMFMPYVDSGQVNGMVVGLNGAAGAEQANGGQPASVIRR